MEVRKNKLGVEIMTPEKQLAKMIEIASGVHLNQKDKQGQPYILHPLAVMSRLDPFDFELRAIAVGHDVIEDGKGQIKVTYAQLYARGFSDRVIEGIRCITRVPGEDEEEYQLKVLSNRDSTRVKKEDLGHNSDITRLKGVDESDFERIKKYHKFYLRIVEDMRTWH